MADALLYHLLISLVPGLAGIVVGGAVGYAGAWGIRRLYSAYPSMRRWSTLLPWRTIVVTVLLWLALPVSARFLARFTGLGPELAMALVGLFTFVLAVPLVVVAIVAPWRSAWPVVRLVAQARLLIIVSLAVATVFGPAAGAGGAGLLIRQGMRGLDEDYALVFTGFAIVILLALAVDVLLGVLQVSFTPRSSLEVQQ